MGCCRKSSANKICERRLGKLIATAADRGRDEISLIDCSVKMFPQRSFLGGKHARDKAGGEFLHDAAVGDPVNDQNRADRKQHKNTDAEHERRHQFEGRTILIQMLGR